MIAGREIKYFDIFQNWELKGNWKEKKTLNNHRGIQQITFLYDDELLISHFLATSSDRYQKAFAVTAYDGN